MSKRGERERREREEAIRPPSDKVRPPRWLSKEAKKEFRRVLKFYEHTDPPLITNADVEALARYADALVRYIKISAKIGDAGYTSVGAQGGEVQNPLLLALAKYEKIVERGEKKFGLDPSSRASLAIPRGEEKPKDPFEERFGS